MDSKINELFVSYGIASQIKAKGFNEPCFGLFDKKCTLHTEAKYKFVIDENNFLAPMYQQAISWFRNNHNIEVQSASWKEGGKVIYIYSVHNILTQKSKYALGEGNTFNTYYEALDKAILTALTLI